MKNNPQVAIMMPVYNGEKTLPLAITSLLHQTYPYWKCYIVNDGSTDGTKKYLDTLNDDRFVIIHFEKNKGRPYARQAALEAAEGKYLAFLDADDFYHPKKLESQIEVLENNTTLSLVSCANASFGKNMKLMTVRGEGSGKPYHVKHDQKPPVALRTSLLRLSIAKTIAFDKRLKHAQDTDFVQKYFQNSSAYLIQPKIFYYYSEFDSVTISKIIKTYYFDFLQLKSNLKGYKKIIKTFIIFPKVIFTFIIYLFFGIEGVLKRRGRAATPSEISDFENILHLLSKN